MEKQTAKFGARVLENLPDMDSDLMQNWIENPKGMQKVLKEAFCPPEQKKIIFTIKNSIISFSLPPTDGSLFAQWPYHFEKVKKKRIDAYVKQWILSPEFKTTTGKIYNIKIVKGELLTNENRTDKGVRQEAERRKLLTPSVEMACLIRYYFTDEELIKIGLGRLMVMHQPFKDSGGDMVTLEINCYKKIELLEGYIDDPRRPYFDRGCGFAFEAS